MEVGPLIIFIKALTTFMDIRMNRQMDGGYLQFPLFASQQDNNKDSLAAQATFDVNFLNKEPNKIFVLVN